MLAGFTPRRLDCHGQGDICALFKAENISVGSKLSYKSGAQTCSLAMNSVLVGFPGGSAGKESARNARDLGSIPGLGRSPGEGKGYPLQYSGLENSGGSQRVGCD